MKLKNILFWVGFLVVLVSMVIGLPVVCSGQITLNDGDQIECGSLYILEGGEVDRYYFKSRNYSCENDSMRIHMVTRSVPDGITVYNEMGAIISGGIAVPNSPSWNIAGFTPVDGPIVVTGPFTYETMPTFPPSFWPLEDQWPKGSMTVLVDVEGENEVTIEVVGNPDFGTVFLVYVECPEGANDYEHEVVVVKDSICTNNYDDLSVDSMLVMDPCADTLFINRTYYRDYEPAIDKYTCYGNEVILDPSLDVFVNPNSIEWEDGHDLPYKMFNVFADTTVALTYYYDDGVDACVFDMYYDIDTYNDYLILTDTIVAESGDEVFYMPRISGFGYNNNVDPETNMDYVSDDLYYSKVYDDSDFYFNFNVNGNGCINIVNLHVKIINTGVYLPNVFRPNSDSDSNRFFEPIFKDGSDVIHYSMMVFDRWGQNVYVGHNSRWDGRFNGQELNPSAFVYIIDMELSNGEYKTLNGTVTLVK